MERVECRIRSDLTSIVNSRTKTINFENVRGQKVNNWRKFYRDPSFIARHFLVRNIADTHKDSVWRHYTVCNAMEQNLYTALVRSLKEESDSTYKEFDKALCDPTDQQQVMVCAKNYMRETGLSAKLHAEV